MRKIKFRVWDKSEKRLIEDSHYLYMDISDGQINDINKDDFREDLILMQYTGMKDKNGKEIYESSIVKCNDFATGNPFNCEVIYANGCFFLAIKNSGYMPLYKALGDEIDSTISDIEVIGTIYENPGLLK